MINSLFSNGPNRDFVAAPFQKCVAASSQVFVAAPYVTMTQELSAAAQAGKPVKLLVGLNASTSATALRAIQGIPNLGTRYFTHRFHAKVYLFDDVALIGSSNLTDGGMQSNREATLMVTEPSQLEEIRALCEELWMSAAVLTPDNLDRFEKAAGPLTHFNPDAKIESAIGRVQPQNIAVGSEKKSSEYLFLQILRRRVYEQFLPAFNEVTKLLSDKGLHRPEWTQSDRGSETNRFLNWVRLRHVPGDDWKSAPIRSADERSQVIQELGREWVDTDNPRIHDGYFEGLDQLHAVFGSPESVKKASRGELADALLAVHAFYEQIRFVKGGREQLIPFFFAANSENIDRIKTTISHLIFGGGDFAKQLYEVLNFPTWKLSYFGESCSLELTGTIKPELCPPMNGRSAKALRFIGFDIPTL